MRPPSTHADDAVDVDVVDAAGDDDVAADDADDAAVDVVDIAVDVDDVVGADVADAGFLAFLFSLTSTIVPT